MNGTVLGLLVVAAIGVVLWAFVFVGVKLIDIIVARRKDFDFDDGTFHSAPMDQLLREVE